MKLWSGPDAATIRAWALATGRPVGSRGAISAALQQQYRLATTATRLRKVGVSAVRVASEVGPGLLRARRDRGPSQKH